VAPHAPLFSPSVALPLSHSLPAHCPAHSTVSTPLRLLLSAQLSPPLLAPDHRLRPLEPSSLVQTPAEHRRRPPLPGELLPELPIPTISCKPLTPSPLPSCRTSSPPPTTTGAPSPPKNVTAPKLFLRLPAVPPLGYAPPPLDLPGVTPELRWCSRGGPCRRLTAVGSTADPPPRCGARAGRNRGWTRPPGRGPAGLADHPAGQAANPPWAGTRSRFRPGTVSGILNIFPIILNSRN
jgi:hypothetical protein